MIARVRLERGDTLLRPFVRGDLDELTELRIRNREFLAPYEPLREERFYTRAGQARELELDGEAWAMGAGHAFAVIDQSDGPVLIGRIALANIVRGPWRNATLGYWIDESHNGAGHATNAVWLITAFAFERAELHRVQPAIMPRNERSARVVRKVGYRREGTARRYLSIAGVWEDHDIYALTREEWKPRKG